MGLFSSNRKNVSINDMSPILADILILDMRWILDYYSDYPEERYFRQIKRDLEKHPEYEVSEKHIKRLSTMMTNFINDLQKTQLMRDLFIYVRRMGEMRCRGHRELIWELLHPDWIGHVTIESPEGLQKEYLGQLDRTKSAVKSGNLILDENCYLEY